MSEKSQFPWYMGGLYLFGRLVDIMTGPAPRVWPFYELSQMGWPYLTYWPEYPPVFDLLSRTIYLIAGGKEHVYGYLIGFVFALAQAVTVVIFAKLSRKIFEEPEAREASWLYLVFALIVSVGAMPFDVIALALMLLGLYWALEAKEVKAGLAIGMGVLTKWFPLFSLAAIWTALPRGKALKITAIAIGLTAAVFSSLYLAFPSNTAASIKGS